MYTNSGMQTISIGGRTYTKATDIARELGYTADYVGQLCRAGKVDAELVGRSWYVNETSLKNHKKTRYKKQDNVTKKHSDSGTTKRKIHTTDKDKKGFYHVAIKKGSDSISTRQNVRFSRSYFSDTQKQHEYYEDDSELIPITQKRQLDTSRQTDTFTNAKKVKIKARDEVYDFDPVIPESKEINFSSKLKISEVPDTYHNEENLEEVAENVEKKPEQIFESKEVRKISIFHTNKKKKKKLNVQVEHNPSGIIGMTASHIDSRNPRGGTLKIHSSPKKQKPSRSSHYVLVVVFVLSVLFSTVLFGLHSIVSVENGTLATTYFFHLKDMLATIYSIFPLSP